MEHYDIAKHIDESVEPKMGEVSARGDRLLAEGVRALWEIALQLAEINKRGLKVHHQSSSV